MISAQQFEKNANLRTEIQTLTSAYPTQKVLTGKSGAYVALVKDIHQNNSLKVLKILPGIDDVNNKYNYRELFYTCLNGFITYQQLGIQIKGKPNMAAFPRAYKIGFTNAKAPGQKATQMVFPYLLMEYIPGKSLTTLGEQAKDNKGIPANTQYSSYSLFAKGQVQAKEHNVSDVNKRRTQAVIYQIAMILYKLNTMPINAKGDPYGFLHNDLNPGNIFVRSESMTGILDVGKGAPVDVEEVPLVTLIDLGQGSSNLDSKLGQSFKDKFKSKARTALYYESGSLADFYTNLNGKVTDWARFTKFFKALDADMRLFRQTVYALLDSGNYLSDEFKKRIADCKTREECVKEPAPAVWPLVSSHTK